MLHKLSLVTIKHLATNTPNLPREARPGLVARVRLVCACVLTAHTAALRYLGVRPAAAWDGDANVLLEQKDLNLNSPSEPISCLEKVTYV